MDQSIKRTTICPLMHSHPVIRSSAPGKVRISDFAPEFLIFQVQKSRPESNWIPPSPILGFSSPVWMEFRFLDNLRCGARISESLEFYSISYRRLLSRRLCWLSASICRLQRRHLFPGLKYLSLSYLPVFL